MHLTVIEGKGLGESTAQLVSPLERNYLVGNENNHKLFPMVYLHYYPDLFCVTLFFYIDTLCSIL